MNVQNVHQRRLAAPADKVGALIDSLASEADRLWPSPPWVPMTLDRPLAVGAAGGHGPIRYVVQQYAPGKSVQFRFTGPKGFDGFHCFAITDVSQSSVVLRHTLQMTARCTTRSSKTPWPRPKPPSDNRPTFIAGPPG